MFSISKSSSLSSESSFSKLSRVLSFIVSDSLISAIVSRASCFRSRGDINNYSVPSDL